MPSDAEREHELFEQALTLTAEERTGFLDEACGENDELRSRIEERLREHESSADTTSQQTWIEDFGDDQDVLVGTDIGGFHIKAVLGEGGMGVVYEAEQHRPARTVALKVVRPMFATRSLLARFDQEAQLLGRLQHPGIAQIYEVGTFETDGGKQPFFAMELVRGKTLLAHVKAHGCETAERLELLARVADAVDHAHRRNVIHRDLKPQNVIVDESEQPKVLDFGIARVTDQDVRSETLQTKTGQVIGTIPYMSPEQIRDRSDELDGRTDVWALGVIGFELLTGRLPIPVGGRGIAEAARMILDLEPDRLSSVSRTYRGDIETIIGKALEKDRDRRYVTAADMAADIRAFLRNQPIKARPASSWYQMCKFAGRNRGLVAGIALAFVSLATGLVFAMKSARDAENARVDTEAALEEAKQQARIAKETVTFLTRDLLGNADVYETAGSKMTMEDAVERAAAALDRLEGQPVVEAAVRQALGFVYFGSGSFEKAKTHLVRALELVPDDRVVMPYTVFEIKAKLGATLNELDEAFACVELMEPLVEALESEPVDDYQLGAAAMVLGDGYEGASRYDEARASYEKAKKHLALARGEDSVSVLNAREFIIGLERRRSTGEELVANLRDIYGARALKQGVMHPMTLRSKGNLAAVLLEAGLLDEALKVGEELEQQVLTVHGKDHLLIGTVYRHRGRGLMMQGRFDEARAPLQRALEVYRNGGHVEFELGILARLMRVERRLGRRGEAWTHAKRAHDLSVAHFGERHMSTVSRAADLAMCSDADEKHELLVRNIEIAEELAPDSEITQRVQNDLGTSFLRRKDYEPAAHYIKLALDACVERWGGVHPVTASSLENYGNVLRRLDRDDEAREAFEETLEVRRAILPEGHPDIGRTLYNLGSLHRKLEDLDEAARLIREAIDLTTKAYGDNHPDAGHMAKGLCRTRRDQRDFKALRTIARFTLKNARARNAKADVAFALRHLGAALMGLGEFEDAEEPLLEQWEIQRELDEGKLIHGHAAYELGTCLLELEEYEEAISRLLEAEAIYGASKDVDVDLKRKLWTKLAAAYTGSGDAESAKVWRARLE